MSTQLPPDEFRKCPTCKPELDALMDVVEARFHDSDTNPTGIALRAAQVLTLGWYHEGILHHKGHPVSLATYGRSFLKDDQVSVFELHDCRTCQDERNWAVHHIEHFFPGFAANQEGVQPTAVVYLCRTMYWLGILHDVDHPVSLTDYGERVKTGDFSIGPPPHGEASDDSWRIHPAG